MEIFIVFLFLNQKEVIPHISKDQYQTNFKIFGYIFLELSEPTLEKTKTTGSSALLNSIKKRRLKKKASWTLALSLF